MFWTNILDIRTSKDWDSFMVEHKLNQFYVKLWVKDTPIFMPRDTPIFHQKDYRLNECIHEILSKLFALIILVLKE